MITFNIPSKNPKKNYSVVTYGTKTQYKYLPPVEYTRRKEIIEKEVAELTYKRGDICRGNDKALYKIMAIATTWMEYKGSETDENKVFWPESNVPMLVHAQRLSDKKVFDCTVGYLKKISQEEENKLFTELNETIQEINNSCQTSGC